MRYKARAGADGEEHMCPNYFSANYGDDLKRWWRSNRSKSLRQMRLDVLKRRIAQEERIGFPSDDSQWEKDYMAQLNTKPKEIEAAE